MKYFKWTPEIETELCNLHREGLSYSEIAKTLGCSYDAAKKKGSNYIKAGILTRRPHYILGDKSEEELLDEIRKYLTRDSAPYPLVYRVIKKYGSWSKGLEAADLPQNIGGVFNPNKQTLLYLLKFKDFYKVGITQQTIKQRFAGSPLFEVLDVYETNLQEAVELERDILSKVSKFVPEDPWFSRNGRTECFTSEIPITKLEDLI